MRFRDRFVARVDGPLRDVVRLARLEDGHRRGLAGLGGKWSPSRSRKTSPSEARAGGRAPAGFDGQQLWMALARRPASWMRAWPCAFSSDLRAPAGLKGMGRPGRQGARVSTRSPELAPVESRDAGDEGRWSACRAVALLIPAADPAVIDRLGVVGGQGAVVGGRRSRRPTRR